MNLVTVTKKTAFAVAWFSPRGFANEGNYVYGSGAELDALHDDYDQYQSKMSYYSTHRTLNAAKTAAEKLARKDHRNTPSHELCCVCAAHISEVFSKAK